MKLRITSIGNSFGLILPKETLAKLKVTGGDAVFITETPDGLRITPYDPEFEAQMNAAMSVFRVFETIGIADEGRRWPICG